MLAREGHLCFTVPVIHGRMTRNRAGLCPSYHGTPGSAKGDFLVHTEFGADVWTFLHRAGFDSVTINHVAFPAATALTAKVSLPLSGAEENSSRIKANDTREVSSHLNGEGPKLTADPTYDQDGLRSVHNHEFVNEPRFQAAYARGCQAADEDYSWHWRVHTGLWAASATFKLPGDFIEFGVNRGFLSSAIMQSLKWNSTGRRFYLLDTFSGIDERYVSEGDITVGVLERNKADIARGFYTFDVDVVRRNFAEWPNALVIQGAVPETLSLVDTDQIAFAHIDMNCAPPEIAAAEFIWPILTPGAIVLLDDYAYRGYRSQKIAMDEFAASKGVSILSLPTGQGLIIKPPSCKAMVAKPSRRSFFKKWW